MSVDRRRILAFAAAALGATVLPAYGQPAPGDDKGFAAWLVDFKAEAKGQGISAATLDAAFNGVEPLQQVLELDRRQPETTLSFKQYLAHVVTPARVKAGRRHIAENRALLTEIGRRYQVQPRFIVALWAVESGFGAAMGNFNTVAALATLAYDGRRSALFRQELLAALRIIERDHIAPAALKGSWAGAMGQTQFMPSSFLRFAVDYHGGSQPDIWTDRADVFASIANYLASFGWNGRVGWGSAVLLPAHFDRDLIADSVQKPVSSWRALGIRRADRRPLPRQSMPAGLVQPGGAGGPVLLANGNFRVMLKWNHSLYFAAAVCELADRFQV